MSTLRKLGQLAAQGTAKQSAFPAALGQFVSKGLRPAANMAHNGLPIINTAAKAAPKSGLGMQAGKWLGKNMLGLGALGIGGAALNEQASRVGLNPFGGSQNDPFWSPNLQMEKIDPYQNSPGQALKNLVTRPAQSLMALSGQTQKPTMQDYLQQGPPKFRYDQAAGKWMTEPGEATLHPLYQRKLDAMKAQIAEQQSMNPGFLRMLGLQAYQEPAAAAAKPAAPPSGPARPGKRIPNQGPLPQQDAYMMYQGADGGSLNPYQN